MSPADELRAAAALLGPSSPAVAAHTAAVRIHPDAASALADLLAALSYDGVDEIGHEDCDRTTCVPAAALAAARLINGEQQ